MSEDPSDIELMARLRADDRDALAALIRRHQRFLVNFFRRMGARTHECEDLAQEAFLRLYQWRYRYRPTGKFGNFLCVLARHAWADMMRKAGRTPKGEGEIGRAASANPGVARVDAAMDAQRFLDRLSDKLRVVVVLNVYQGLDYREIAEVLDIPLGTVKSRMHLALKQLREQMNVDE